jgi:hypothetical protein
MVLGRSNKKFGTTTNLKFDMCQDKKKDTSEKHEKNKFSSYTRIMSRKKKKKKMTTMEMFLPYTSH